MKEGKKTHFDHALDRALRKARCLVEDILFVRELHREDKDERAYGFTLATVETAEELALKVRELAMSQRIPDSEPEIQRMIDAVYKVELGFTKDGYFCMRFPRLIPGMNGRSMLYLRKNLAPRIEEFWNYRGSLNKDKHIIIFRHVYPYCHPGWERHVPADGEVDFVLGLVLKNVCHAYYASDFKHYHCCGYGEDRTEVYVVPTEDFPEWLEQEPDIPLEGWKLYESAYDAMKAEGIK